MDNEDIYGVGKVIHDTLKRKKKIPPPHNAGAVQWGFPHRGGPGFENKPRPRPPNDGWKRGLRTHDARPPPPNERRCGKTDDNGKLSLAARRRR